jgi:hypothetical protein
MDNAETSPMSFIVKDENGKELITLDATAEAASAIIFLVDRATKTQREKLAAWMLKQGFATGHGDTQEDLLKELSWQIKELRTEIAALQTELEDESI